MKLPVILLWIVAAGSCLPVSAVPLYVIFDLGTLGGASSTATDINRLGQIVGSSETAGGAQHAFLYTHGVGMRDLGTLGGQTSTATSINDRGHVTGMSGTADGSQHAYLYKRSTGMTDLNVLLDAPILSAKGINNADQITGALQSSTSMNSRISYLYTPGVGLTHIAGNLEFNEGVAVNNRGQVAVNLGRPPGPPYLYTPGSGLEPLDLPGGWLNGLATDLNDSGQLVGFGSARTTFENHGHLYIPGDRAIDLGTLGGEASSALGINNRGMVVGSSQIASGAERAFVYVTGEGMFDLNTLTTAPDWVLTTATAINDRGMIAGTGLYKGQTHAFLAIDPPADGSTPEPGTWALLGTGLLGLRISGRKRVR